MRKSSADMSVWDDRILELLNENGAMSVGDIYRHEYIRKSKSTVSRRVNRLQDKGLTEEIANGVYRITEQGVGYLSEEYDVENEVWLNQDQADGPDSVPSGPTPEEAGNGGDDAQ
jgi:Mn-dependent DtxR family transcriptional regulator